jgi:hypothetical protein
MLNQHNPLYNNKLGKNHVQLSQISKNEKVLQDLSFHPQNIAMQEKNLIEDCSATGNYVKAFEEFSIVKWECSDTLINLKWQFKLKTRELTSTQSKKCKLKSAEQLILLKNMEDYKKENKHWDKVTKEERIMLPKMSVNNFKENFHFNSIRNVIKKEVWNLAMKDLKRLGNSIKAKCAKQILF